MATIGTFFAAAEKSTNGNVVIGPPSAKKNHSELSVAVVVPLAVTKIRYEIAIGIRMAVSMPNPAMAGMMVFFFAAAYSENENASVMAIHGIWPVCTAMISTPVAATATASHWTG